MASHKEDLSEKTAKAKNSSPQPTKKKLGKEDTLTSCLKILTDFLERPLSEAALKAGLPLEDNCLTPEYLTRAASRAGLSSRLLRKSLEQISPYTLPCILILNDNKACLLVKFINTTHAEVIFPETGKGKTRLSIEELKKIYKGYAFFARPEYRYDHRSSDLSVKRPRFWFWGTFLNYWPIYSQVAIAATITNTFAVATPLFTMNVYDRVVPNNATATLWGLVIGITLIFVFDFILKSLRVYYLDTAGKNADILLSSRIFEHIMGIELAHKPQSSGGFANQLREFETLREFFSSATLVTLIDLPFIFLFIIIIAVISPILALVPLLFVPIILLSTLYFEGPLRNKMHQSFREGAQKHAILVEAINGLETVKCFGAEGKMQRNWENFVFQAAHSSKALKLIGSLALNFSASMQQFSYIVVITLGVYLISIGELTMGGLVACSILSARALSPLSQVVGLLTRVNHSMTALKALDKIIALPVERPVERNFVHRPHIKGDIEVSHVTFSYPHQQNKAIDNLSFKISAGERIGLVGQIGSGKSTIQKLLLALYASQEGSIKLDGTDIRQIDPVDVRNNIGYVPQDIFLFHGTVWDNITFGSQVLDEQIVLRAAEISGVLDFVRLHPRGFDMPVGEGGSGLSGGQRQAIALARALVRNPSIYLLDEPTAMMDSNSELQFITRFKHILKDQTLLVTSHRIPILNLTDRLIVMQQGNIIADGPRDTIIQALSNIPQQNKS